MYCTLHRYMAVPRTPVQTDRLDTTEASAIYRATRDKNNSDKDQVNQHCFDQLSNFIICFVRGNFISLKNELLPVEASLVSLPQTLHIHICSHFKRRSLKKLQVGVLQVALVTLGRHIGLLNNWYCLPEENEVSDRFYKWIRDFT